MYVNYNKVTYFVGYIKISLQEKNVFLLSKNSCSVIIQIVFQENCSLLGWRNRTAAKALALRGTPAWSSASHLSPPKHYRKWFLSTKPWALPGVAQKTKKIAVYLYFYSHGWLCTLLSITHCFFLLWALSKTQELFFFYYDLLLILKSPFCYLHI